MALIGAQPAPVLVAHGGQVMVLALGETGQ
jgi:hypothetical protein